VLIVQHMPEHFTASFAKRLDQVCALRVSEARDGEILTRGRAWVAPGHSHLRLERQGNGYVLRLDRSEPVNRHRPSVDVLFFSAAEVLAVLGKPTQTLIDARATPRYRGEVEPLDPVAGHIPGALNRPFTLNFQDDGRFKPAAQLRAEFEALLENRAPASVVHYCGSGVSAIPNLLAMEVAGLGPTALFAGSWSEWCSDPARPVERG